MLLNVNTADDKRLPPPQLIILHLGTCTIKVAVGLARRPVVFTIGRMSFVSLISTGIPVKAADRHGLARASPRRKTLNAGQPEPTQMALCCDPAVPALLLNRT